MKTKIILIIINIIFFLGVSAQNNTDNKKIKKADTLFLQEKYKKAYRIYKKYAVKNNSVGVLYKAGLCYEHLSGKDHCLFFKQMIENGFLISDQALFFYGCKPKTFERININKIHKSP
jgi:uncharacterized membrane protein YukC